MTQRMKWLGFLATTLIVVMLGINIVREGSRQQHAQKRHAEAAITEGVDLYALYCASCHGAAGEGLAAYPALDQAFVREQDSRLLFTLIKRGRYNTEMTAFGVNENGVLTTAQIDNLVTMLQHGSWQVAQQRVAELGLTPTLTALTAATPNQAALSTTSLSPEQAIVLAREVFSTTCSECHGVNGEGTAKAPQLNNAYVRGMAQSQIVNIITLGVSRTEMDSFGDTFSADQLAALVYLLQNWGVLEGNVAVAASPTIDTSAVTETGQQLFEMWCAPCHGTQGEGGSIAPSLNDIPSISADFITSRVRSGYNAMPPFAETDLSPAQLVVLIDYAQTTILGSKLPALTDEEMTTAADLYALQCAECHGEVGQGTVDKGPALVVMPPLRASEITNFVRFGSALAVVIPPDALSDEDLRLIIAYIHSLSGSHTD